MAASFDSYKIFYYVGKYGNITRAASTLFLSQSTVSRTIQSLESELGCRLFDRYPHGVVLTQEGERLFQKVAAGCELILGGEDELKRIAGQQESCLRIGANEFVYQQYLIPALAEFAQFYPDVGIELTMQRCFGRDQVFSSLCDASLDLVFTFSPIPDGADLYVQSVAETGDVLVAGSRFSELRDRSVGYAELKDYPFAVRTAASGSTSFLEEAFRLRGVTLRPRYRMDTISGFIPMLRQGLCLAVLPKPVFDSLPNAGELFPVRLAEPLPTRSICIVTSRAHPLSPAEEELIRCFRRQISGRDNLKL